MTKLLRSNDMVLLSWVEVYLRDAGIESVLLDQNISVLEGSIGAFNRRLMVLDDDEARARALLQEADIEIYAP
ncbi:MAG: DUF2007 domain-containing protein [Alphaproteobacteria bacterium]|jgi:hypothetical protein|nr:hypothetical protein [Rhodospirillaceae bacterium]MDP6021884.1 DUF2007 domain-containing protein [Alphaproteobacteria bacterium]MDP6256942.1 DUF2007 domain-containing protein [Alphaproteobacteria bacterium]MDP7054353.1 DUF2007 domain-containing protein [Alphaproteobacteria bacterium]MDP7230868.1 DUF2007 domain-containing protein [Alphaproteobacteria bacterium]|tara:strand:+ start:1915 stop:2133 length:219 start_codon:yes stop_codon:yes gene_type:complete